MIGIFSALFNNLLDAQSFQRITLENTEQLSYILDSTTISSEEPSNLIIALHWGWDRSQPVSDSHVQEFHNKFVKEAVKLDNSFIVTIRCPYSGWDNKYSVSAIDQLLNHLLVRYKIDETSLALIGYSAGGIGCWYYLQTSQNNIFKVIVPIAARPPINTRNLENQSISIVHGAKDDYFDVKNVRNFYEALKTVSANANLIIVPGAQHVSMKEYSLRVTNILSSLKYKYQ